MAFITFRFPVLTAVSKRLGMHTARYAHGTVRTRQRWLYSLLATHRTLLYAYNNKITPTQRKVGAVFT
jgi:hypothetical protein